MIMSICNNFRKQLTCFIYPGCRSFFIFSTVSIVNILTLKFYTWPLNNIKNHLYSCITILLFSHWKKLHEKIRILFLWDIYRNESLEIFSDTNLPRNCWRQIVMTKTCWKTFFIMQQKLKVFFIDSLDIKTALTRL